jgi:predicted nuclease with TOPRIM domain
MGSDAFVQELREKTRELGSMLDAYSERLRRMRQRNRELEEEISSFEADLDRLREWLVDRLDEPTD